MGNVLNINYLYNLIGGKRVFIPNRPGETKRSCADITKIKRDLELGYAEKVVDYISTLWGGVVRIDTVIEDEPFEI